MVFSSNIPIGVFAVLVSVAMILNIVSHHLFLHFGSDEIMNLFFISPYHPCTLPILSTVYTMVPYPAFLAIYIVSFALIAAIFFYLYRGLAAVARKRKASCHA